MFDKTNKLLYFKEKLNIMNIAILILKDSVKNSAKLLMKTLGIEMRDAGVTLEEEYSILIEENYFEIIFFVDNSTIAPHHKIKLIFLEENQGELETDSVKIVFHWQNTKYITEIEVPCEKFFGKNFINIFTNAFVGISLDKEEIRKRLKEIEKTA